MFEQQAAPYKSTQVLPNDAVLAALEHSLAMIEFDTHGNVLWANGNFAKTMGYAEAELPGIHHRRFCTPEFASSSAYEHLWNQLRRGTSFQERISRVTKDGRLLWFEATYTPVMDANGSVQGIVKVATDITARENATARMTAELQLMSEHLLNQTEEGIKGSREIEGAMELSVQQSNDNMEVLQSLEKETKSVSRMISIIQEVASQTKLLALNAAIEAAHAGEYGRGFSVVADEVRKLAKQADDTSKEINGNLKGIAAQVDNISTGMKRAQTTIANSLVRVQLAGQAFTAISQSADVLDTQAKTMVELL
ncbi:methyl-accepting chemotaxis protein [Paenibacillus chondroitinus]|uniref:Methyl-accepting chemotaxis protein n=1 Tax=Paenibacillus chondroitinus TaxID=59842 RepID=A0ABU6DEU7_9BACL|nr:MULTISPECIES: methyl-accepting chemotaxis protein [Paenibacillus]MCY9661506.1 methyl-accepting chemotaxis protein [Paenibacillus anseongense]MEB4796274.1 methyl-accepting chemotaxis protein [Paenibacillus chondroitinus]